MLLVMLPRCLGGGAAAFLRSTVFLLVVLCLPAPSLSCIQAEREILLCFLSNLTTTSQAALSSWGPNNGTDCCLWEGIKCDSNGSITDLSLPNKGLQGRISPAALRGLTRLVRLNLSHNSLSGKVDFASLVSGSLELLDLSYNSLSGQLPPQLSSAIKLKTVDISSNRFNGSFPPPWADLKELQALNCSNNGFSGSIPSGICSAYPQLVSLDLSWNELNGHIPVGLGNCSKLSIFRAENNNLTGEIPSDIYEAVSLQNLSLAFNHLSGKLDGITKLRDLTLLDLSGNRLDGTLPDSIGMLTKLEHLVLNSNNLTGTLPPSLHNCTRLRCLILRENNFSGVLSAVDFSSLSDLDTLDLGNNNFTGSLPASIYSCRSLTALRLAKNSLQGEIAPQLVNLTALSFLSLSANKLKNISKALEILKRCKNLTTIVLSTNFIGESMPMNILDRLEQVDAFSNLRVLGLANCQLTGQVPPWLSKLTKLEVLDLSLNKLTGPLPRWLGNLRHLFYIDLSENNFEPGTIPLDFMNLTVLATKQAAVNRSSLPLPVFVTNQIMSWSLQYNQLTNLPAAIYLRKNGLEGAIPPEVGQLVMLQVLDLSQNNLSGGIPVQISNLANLQKLVLSENHLSGSIPKELIGLNFLSSFNVSYNNLSGPIPVGGQFDSFGNTSFEGNPGLCGMAVRPCTNETSIGQQSKINKNKKLITGVIIGICFGGALVFTLFVLFMLSRRKGKLPEFDMPENKDVSMVISNSAPEIPHDEVNKLVVLFPGNTDLKSLKVSEIFTATNNFSQEFIIGCGGFGLVYRAVLSDGTKLAVKKLSGETGIMEREFKAEVEALSNARHENLVSLQGYSMHGSFRFLIYSYMDNGSLDYWLHEKIDGASALTWPIRLEIARGTSRGLAYIHQICEPHIVHRDIKSSNILLDHKFQAHVADFGLSRLILPTNTHVSTELVGTLGYIPPEYGQAWIATLRGDIYSFGVVMLELLTGRRPFEVFKPKQSRDLVGWVQQLRGQGKPEQIFDPLLKDGGFDDQMLQVLDVACLCVNSNPFKRPTIRDIVYWLDNVEGDQQAPR